MCAVDSEKEVKKMNKKKKKKYIYKGEKNKVG